MLTLSNDSSFTSNFGRTEEKTSSLCCVLVIATIKALKQKLAAYRIFPPWIFWLTYFHPPKQKLHKILHGPQDWGGRTAAVFSRWRWRLSTVRSGFGRGPECNHWGGERKCEIYFENLCWCRISVSTCGILTIISTMSYWKSKKREMWDQAGVLLSTFQYLMLSPGFKN